jgi:hypothetical protein
MAKKSVPKKPVSKKSASSKSVPSKSVPSKSVSSKPTSSKPGSSKSVSSKPTSSKKSPEKTVSGNPNPIAAHMNLTLIEVADPTDLSALMADSRVGSLIAARLSDLSAIITPDKTDVLLKALKDGGHTPKIVRLESARGEA